MAHRPSTAAQARRRKLVDQVTGDLGSAVADADMVILATPVALISDYLRRMEPHLPPFAIVTDVGSTKTKIVAAAEALLKGKARFVGSHPIAGSEKRGLVHADPKLFAGRPCVITPTRSTDRRAVLSVERFWKRLGMQVVRMSPQKHDETLASISHLPHLLASALMHHTKAQQRRVSGSGLADMTRLAAGDPALWCDIFMDNRQSVRRSIKAYQKQLNQFVKLLERGDAAKITTYLKAAAKARSQRSEIGSR